MAYIKEAYINEQSIENPEIYREVKEILAFLNANDKSIFWRFKRVTDVVCSVLALVIFAVPMLMIALIIFLEDGHSPIFRQVRVGRYGEEFHMYKFRTMVPDADKLKASLMAKNEMDGPVFKITNDPRITKVGGFLRKTSLDELPQFFNVIIGNMTLIGPRPPLPDEVAQYTEFHKLRLLVTPGITCIWQVAPDRNSIPFDEWMRMDIQYVMHRTILLDLEIVLKTVRAMVSGEGK